MVSKNLNLVKFLFSSLSNSICFPIDYELLIFRHPFFLIADQQNKKNSSRLGDYQFSDRIYQFSDKDYQF